MTQLVSDTIRSANSRAIDRRDRWRDRYSLLTKIIRENKHVLKQNPFDREAQIKAKIYRQTADEMMCDRWVITLELRSTAYPYADFSLDVAI